MTGIFRYGETIDLEKDGPFPAKVFLSSVDTPLASVKVGELAVGSDIPIHSHETSSQLEYYPKGKATLFLEGVGEVEIRPGAFMFAPKGVKHGITDVKEKLIIYSVFVPALF